MTTYKEIRGTNIEAVASDPSNPVEGQVWYNTTTNVVKGLSFNSGTWATSGNLNTARRFPGGAGTQEAALGFGGGPPATAVTELYNGSNWTEVNDLNTARNQLAGLGTQPSALAFGGEGPPNLAITELWNGSSWSEQSDLNAAIRFQGGAGTTTAGLSFGGDNGPVTAATESWNVPSTVTKSVDTD